MTTEAQINANRENAQKSTGPLTPEGKTAVSQNALKHGLFAVRDVVTHENQAEFDAMREQMLADLAPVGAVESLLAQRAFSLAWRLRRAEIMQSQALEDMMQSHDASVWVRTGGRSKDPRDAPEYLALGDVAEQDWCGSRLIERLFEYERRIEKSLYRTMAELRAMQLMRQMTQADAAEARPLAQADAKANSEKQSQSGETESSSQKLPDRDGIDLKELSAFLKKTYGDRYPEMVETTLKRWNASSAQPKPICDPQTGGNGKKRHIPLSGLLRL